MLKSLKSTGKARGHPAARRAVPRQRRGDDPHASCSSAATSRAIIGLPANLFYGTGIPACIVVLDKENAQARTGIFMIDASKGFDEGRHQEPPAQPGHPQDRRRLQQADRDRALLAHGAAERDRRPEERLQPQHPALHRLAPSPRTSRTCTPTCTAASRTATSTRCSRTGTRSRACAPSCSSRTATGYSDLAVDKADVQQTILDSAEFQKFATSARGHGRRLVRRPPRRACRHRRTTPGPTT